MAREQVRLLQGILGRFRANPEREIQLLLELWAGRGPMKKPDGFSTFARFSDFVSLVDSVETETIRNPALNFASGPITNLRENLLRNRPNNAVAHLDLPYAELDMALHGIASVQAAQGDNSEAPDLEFLMNLASELESLLTEIAETVQDENVASTLLSAVNQILNATRQSMITGTSSLRKGAFEATRILEQAAPSAGEVQPNLWRKVGAVALTLMSIGMVAIPAIDSGINILDRLSAEKNDLVVQVECGWNPPALMPGAPASAGGVVAAPPP